jgi:hypothetical protein
MLNFGGTLNGGTYNTIDGAALEFNGDYKLVNINKYDEPDAPDPAVVQTMTKSVFNYSNITQITEPLTGSRIGSTGNFKSIKAVVPTKLDGDLKAKLLKLITKRK